MRFISVLHRVARITEINTTALAREYIFALDFGLQQDFVYQ